MTPATQHKTIKLLFTRHCPSTVTQPDCVCACVFVCSNAMADACACVLSVSQQTKRITPLCRNLNSSSCLALWFLLPPHGASVAGASFSASPQPVKHSSNFQTGRLPMWLLSGWAHTGFRLSSLQASAGKKTAVGLVNERRTSYVTWEHVHQIVSTPTSSANTFTANHKVAIWP